MNQKQQTNVAKYCYDVSKISLTILVIGSLVNSENYRLWVIISGIITTATFLIIGYIMDEKEV